MNKFSTARERLLNALVQCGSVCFLMKRLNGARACPGYHSLGGAKEKNERLASDTPTTFLFSSATILLLCLYYTCRIIELRA